MIDRNAEAGRRLAIRFKDSDAIRIYDIDADGRVYWCRPRGEKLQRYRVFDSKLIDIIKEIAARQNDE